MGRHVPGHDRAGPDERVGPDLLAADDGCVGADGRAAPHGRRPELVLALDFRARIVDVGEDAGGAAEDAVLQDHAFIQRHVVLYLAAVPHDDVRANHDVLPDDAVPPHPAVPHEVAEVPDPGSSADVARFVHVSALVDLHGGMHAALGRTGR